MRHADHGGPGEGPRVVYLHGLGGSRLDWTDLATIMRPHVRGLAVDLPGFGATPTGGRSTSVTSNADATARWLHAVVREPVVLVGTSMGALIAASVAARAPELILGIALVSTPMPGSALGSHGDVRRAALAGAIPGIGEYLLRRRQATVSARERVTQMLRRSCHDPARISPATLAALIRTEEQASVRPASQYLRAARSIAMTVACWRAYWARLSTITVPVLLVHAIHDQLVPIAAARAAARRFPLWSYAELDCGHVAHLESPGDLAGILLAWIAAAVSPTLR
ncbi:alpha/beta hydrolase [Hamadaea sp. NPDC050747]|uniref:alpha/beta fold hydrolase n=1 Tax=Hamadaea sp. NPDC050747 TaxID=3155789 RepID=UPI003411A54A